jgi:F0F1-type ATP synthase assembly protein I
MKNNSSSSNPPWWQPGLLLFFRLSGYIAVPVIIAVFVGKWLDAKYGTEPWLFLITVGLAFIVSMVGLVREAMKEYKKLEELDSEKKDSEEKAPD